MKKVKLTIVASVLTAAAAYCIADITAVSSKPKYEIRKVNEQVVLYTIYRGPYEKMGQAIGKLFAAGGQKGIIPRGKVQYAYLNNPQNTSKEHYLTEIRIPVSKDALKYAGTLGEMTDIKILPENEMVVAKKPKGLADPNSIYNDMNKWVNENKYFCWDSAVEVIISGELSGDYSQMEAEIIIPVKKIE